MYVKFLFPNRFKMLGWIMAIPAFVLMLFVLHNDFSFAFLDYTAKGSDRLALDNGFIYNVQSNNFTDEIGSLLLISGLLFIAFSKEKDEDEMISKLRLESLLWAVFINSIFVMLAIIFIYNLLFLNVMAYNICTTLILFIARFNLVLQSERKKLNQEAL
ncbi:hypothetical protein [Flavihumibacter fluvii]|uniref:hypothetical protein n=1 Tax=Flavihumibacter fluvii TaxID=2838157 RepID=UPI001BDE97DD|nr:hypothetical protein [Flavihumibacter fluvii]ULQ53269.1 hypothetical protein KJS93_02930 [Flavihumibacter fluvii]